MRKSREKCSVFTAVTTLYICLLMTGFLFWCGESGYEGIATGKYQAFLAICGGYIALMIVVALESAVIGNAKFISPIKAIRSSSWAQRIVVIYIVITWISAAVSPCFPDTIIGVSRYEGALTITIYGLCFLLVSMYGKLSKCMLWVLGISVLIFSAICTVQLCGGNPFGLFPDGYNYFGANVDYGGAYLGTIGNVDMVAAFYCIVIPIFWISVVRCSCKQKYLLLLPLAASLFVLLKMNVLGGLLGVFGGAVLSLPVVLPVSAKNKKRMWIVIGGCLVAAIVLLVFVDIGSGVFHEVHELLHGRSDDRFGSGRIYIWKTVLEEIPTRFWAGSGPDTMQRAGFQFDNVYDVNITTRIDVAHSEYLNILYHQGIFALVAYCCLLADCARKWLRYSTHTKGVAVLGGVALCYCIQAFTGISYCGTTIFFWVIIGLLDGLSHSDKTEGA